MHQFAWNGDQKNVKRLLKKGPALTSLGQSPLLLAIQRWGNSNKHQAMVKSLWDADPSPHLARWGDSAWGGGLSLLDLVIQKDLPKQVVRCKDAGLVPHQRTWAMALIHDSDRPLITLGLHFDPPDYLPQDQQRVRKMLALRTAHQLEAATEASDTTGSARRL